MYIITVVFLGADFLLNVLCLFPSPPPPVQHLTHFYFYLYVYY